MLRVLPSDDGDAPEYEGEGRDFVADVRARLAREPSRGVFLEVVQLSSTHLIEHVVVPPRRSATVAGVTFFVDGRGGARFDGGVMRSGETLRVAAESGELWLRFVPAPARLLPADASRLALVALLVLACVSAFSTSGARPHEPAQAVASVQTQSAQSSARRRRFASRVRATLRRSIAKRVRARRPRVRRTVRPARRAGPRRVPPANDGDGDGDGSDPDPDPDIRARRPVPLARARGPPAEHAALVRRARARKRRRKSCWWCKSS